MKTILPAVKRVKSVLFAHQYFMQDISLESITSVINRLNIVYLVVSELLMEHDET